MKIHIVIVCVLTFIVCLKHLWGCAIDRLDNLTEEKSCVLNETTGMAILVPIVRWKFNLVYF
jgi:hypothetical protein